jgi:hypothetical protein
MSKVIWPDNKKFAFSIVDDTDHARVDNVELLYKYLAELGILITKTVWVYPSRDVFTGETLMDDAYLKFIQKLKAQGFEIAFHGAGSGDFFRAEIEQALEHFRDKLGAYPLLHTNHANNADNIYWGRKRFSPLFQSLMRLNKGRNSFYGEDEQSVHFWGDMAREKIKYMRNYTFNEINTLRCDPFMPYRDSAKPYSNYWFSSSDGHTLQCFLKLMDEKNIDLLEKQGGLSIVYTHFGCGFQDKNGVLNEEFKKKMDYLSSKQGWFAPVSEILDYMLQQKGERYISKQEKLKLDFIWLAQRIQKKIWRKL